MRIRCHFLPVHASPWVVNDPVPAAGADGLEAFYASIWSHPALLRAARGIPEMLDGGAPAGAEGEIHLVPLTGEKKAWLPPALRPGDRIFFDGPGGDPVSANRAGFPQFTSVTSLKERLVTPAGEFLIPENLRLGIWDRIPEGWTGMGDRDGTPFYLFSAGTFMSPVNSAYVDFLLRRDKGRGAWNWRYFLAAALSRWLEADEERFVLDPCRERDLRDAFSSFGFHRWVVLKTAGKLDAAPELSSADTAIMEAVEEFYAERWDRAERLVGMGFDGLKKRLDVLTGTTRRYFSEAHHGGMLHDDIGFFEHDWPQMVCDTLREFMARPGVVASLDMPANVYRHYRERFPSFFRELCEWIGEGRIEVLNGMFGQPLSDAHSLENLLSQFIEGHRELRSLFGRHPDIFAMEEYSLGPAMPQILEAAGIRKAVHAVRLGGSSKTNSPALRLWKGIGNGCVEAIEHPDAGTPGLSTTYFLQLPEAFAQSGRLQRKMLALFNLPDFGWNVLFRDEIFAGLKFGATLFEMVAFQKLFSLLPRMDEHVHGRWEDTYHTIFNQYNIRGNMRWYFERLRHFEALLVAAEIGACFSGKPGRQFSGAWQDYLLGSSHDYSLVGAGLNGWYGAATNATYRGPVQITFQRTLESVMSEKLNVWQHKLTESLAVDPDGAYLTNLHGFQVSLGPCSTGGGVADDALGPFSSVRVPSARKRLASAPSLLDGDAAVLESGNTRCRIARETGAVDSVRWKGRTLWDNNPEGIRLSSDQIQMADGSLSDPFESADGHSITHRGRLADTKGRTVGWLETVYLLKAGADDLLVEMVLCPAVLPPRGDFDWKKEWEGTFRYGLPRVGPSREVMVCQGNAMLRVDPGKRDPGDSGRAIPDSLAHVTSPEVLGFEAAEGCPVWYFNAGFPSYLVYGDRIEQFLRMPGEEHLRLRFGMGFGHNLYSPVQRSRMMFYPPLRTRKPMPPLPVKWKNARIGLLRVEPGNGDSGCKLWFWNYGDGRETFAPKIAPGHRIAGISSAGGNLSPNPAGAGWVAGPSSLIQIQLDPAKPARNPHPAPLPEPKACALA